MIREERKFENALREKKEKRTMEMNENEKTNMSPEWLLTCRKKKTRNENHRTKNISKKRHRY